MFSDILKAILLGIIQGFTEWLPISSTGHLLLFDSLWPLLPPAFFEVFKVVIQFGSILAVIMLYWDRLNPFAEKLTVRKRRQIVHLWVQILIGAIPAGIAGLLLDGLIEQYLSANFVIAVTLIAYGIIFILISLHPKKPTIRSLSQLSWKQSLGIGCFQCLALIPGTSRSGATIIGGLEMGCSRAVASEFSFFVAIPVMAGASVLKIVKFWINTGWFTGTQLLLLLLGTVTAFVVSVYAVRALLSYVRTHTFEIFGWYRIVLGILVLCVFYLF